MHQRKSWGSEPGFDWNKDYPTIKEESEGLQIILLWDGGVQGLYISRKDGPGEIRHLEVIKVAEGIRHVMTATEKELDHRRSLGLR